ncbi:endodeoxyribonuclease [Pleosporales sp. CAS-2024a]
MAIDEIEDMLFGQCAAVEHLESDAGSFSDDDLLDEADLDELTLWDEMEDTLELPPHTNRESEGHPTLYPTSPRCAVHEALASDEGHSPRDRFWVIARIEGMLERLADSLLDEDDALTITLKSRAGLSRRRTDATRNREQAPEPRTRNINFPGATAQEAWNFTVLLRILEIIHSSLIDGTTLTKRDLYYRHPDLFVKQSVVDRYVDDLACTFGISRSQLNVTAAAKGLVAGNFSVMRQEGYRIQGLKEKEGLLVPRVGEHDKIGLALVDWVLVVEKEATFRSLLSSAQWDILGSHGLVLTAKGYPDLASRLFLGRIADERPDIPFFALMDWDPDGIAIASTYKYGSYRLAHEDARCKGTRSLSLAKLQWLGVKRQHVSRTPADQGDADTSAMPAMQGLMKLTARDRIKAARMLEWDLCAENGPEPMWRAELQTMLVLNTKAEMQILEERPGGLARWVSCELRAALERGPETDGAGSDDGMLF